MTSAGSVRSTKAPRSAKVKGAGDLLIVDRAGRSTVVRLPRHGAAALGVVLALGMAWSAASAGYIFFHDAVVAELRQSAKASAKAYEAQIAALENEVERSRTRRLVEQTGATQRLAELMRRQETLERRQHTLAQLTDATSSGLAPDAPSDRVLSFTAKPTPLDRPTTAFDGLGEQQTRTDAPVEKLSSALDKLEAGQATALEAIGSRVGDHRAKIRKIYDSLGVDARLAADGRGRGGPFEPLPVRARTFEARAEQIASDRASLVTLRRGLDAIPLRSPAPPGSSISSGFGSRLDPFLRQPAFHAGIDFESQTGQPIRATAPGRVTNAGPSGGYGNMVEIDHGGGLTTRFGHMSSIAVQVGQQVDAGTIVGRVGSTGRSTGPHLHYETRIDGEAVDPIRFLRAGQSLAALKN